MAKGCWRVRIGKKLKVEQAAYRRSRPQWSVTSALGPVHPMAPQGATRVGGRKSLRHTLLVPFRRLPFWWLAPPPSPRFVVGLWVLGRGVNRFFHRAAGPVCLFSPPDRAVLMFYQNWRRRRPPPPSGPKGPSNLRTLRTLGAEPRQPFPLNLLNPHARRACPQAPLFLN